MEGKTKLKLLILGLMIAASSGTIYETHIQPEQLHLSYGDGPTEMVMTWLTRDTTNGSYVEYGLGSLDKVVKGVEDVFIDGGSEHRHLHIHRVKLTDLTPGTAYVYHVGSPVGWSPIYTFTAMKAGVDWSPRFAVYGDMGNYGAKAMGSLQEETQHGHFDAILHVGDFAYNMDTDNGRVGDAFLNQIESIAAYVPYMTAPGNHEYSYNFSNYKNRFTMPGDSMGMYYSFDVGPVHFVSFTAEFFYYQYYGWEQIANQYVWLEQDLKEAAKPENRAERPWIITLCHRPMYCSNNDDVNACLNIENNMARVGLPGIRAYGTEDLLYKYGVDLHIAAHEHSYERMWPVYNMTVCNGTESPYVDPPAPVHIVTGSAGNAGGQDPFVKFDNPWSAIHTDDFGYTRMTVHNASHLSIQQISVDTPEDTVFDEMVLVKNARGPYTCHKQVEKHQFKMPKKLEEKYDATWNEYRKMKGEKHNRDL